MVALAQDRISDSDSLFYIVFPPRGKGGGSKKGGGMEIKFLNKTPQIVFTLRGSNTMKE